MVKFALKRGYSDTESKALNLYKIMDRSIDIQYFNNAKDVPDDFIPVGVIDWVTDVLGYVPKPDYYPDFVQHLLNRKIWECNEWPMEKGIFIKPSDKPKRFQHRITTGTYKGKKKPPYWCSEIINFTNEWRYYIADGKVIYVGWYSGIDDEAKLPEFDESVIPSDWCGCVDIGTINTGEITLVECGEPYSIGWYGELTEGKIYAEFLEKGWKYLLRRRENDNSEVAKG